MKKIAYSILLLLYLSTSCTKPPKEPVPDTKVHVNTFSCRVNGALWEAKPKINTGILTEPNDLYGELWVPPNAPTDTGMVIKATNRTTNELMNIIFPLQSGVDTTICTSNVVFTGDLSTSCGDFYIVMKDKPNKIVITNFDTKTHLIKGTFEFSGKSMSSTCPEFITITEGVFDLKYIE